MSVIRQRALLPVSESLLEQALLKLKVLSALDALQSLRKSRAQRISPRTPDRRSSESRGFVKTCSPLNYPSRFTFHSVDCVSFFVF